jgi:hypothetical protein
MKKPTSQSRLHQAAKTRKAQKRKIKLNEQKRSIVREHEALRNANFQAIIDGLESVTIKPDGSLEL